MRYYQYWKIIFDIGNSIKMQMLIGVNRRERETILLNGGILRYKLLEEKSAEDVGERLNILKIHLI